MRGWPETTHAVVVYRCRLQLSMMYAGCVSFYDLFSWVKTQHWLKSMFAETVLIITAVG
ncbi:hypothetical protein SP21_16 [Salmonella phage 21]|nr:hypothetical protein SP21_16 [Salmonella phage 21]